MKEYRPKKKNIKLTQGAVFRRAYQIIKNGKAINLSTLIPRAQFRSVVADEDDPTPLHDFTVANGGIIISDEIHALTSITEITEDSITCSGATFSDVFGTSILKKKLSLNDSFYPGDRVTITGTTANDGIYEVIEIVSEYTLKLDRPLTPESNIGQMKINRLGEIVIKSIESNWTFKTAVWDLELSNQSGETTKLFYGNVDVIQETTR